MRKILLLFLALFLCLNSGFCAEREGKLPLKITPVNSLTTAGDTLEVGDVVEFRLTKDVYNGDKIFLNEGTTILGYVDFIKENGWVYDNAQIEFRRFDIRNFDGTLRPFKSYLLIDGFQLLKYYNPKWKRFFQYIGGAFRGKEVDLIPDSGVVFNIWYK